MKKRVSLLLAAVLILGMLTACQTGNRNQSAATSADESTEVVLTSLAASKTTTAYAVGDAVDFNDVSAVMAYSDGSYGKTIAYGDFSVSGLSVYLTFDGEAFTGETFSEVGTYLMSVYLTSDSTVGDVIEIAVTESGDVYPTEITISGKISLTVGDTGAIKVSFSPVTTTVKDVTWTSSDPSVATVDEAGNVTAVSAGTATVTASAASETGRVTGECVLTVREPSGEEIKLIDQTGDFTLSTSGGDFTKNDSIYTITAAGEYDLSGNLEGGIVVNAGENDEVVLNLNGVTISYDKNSPILILSADSVTIKATKETENAIYDKRSAKTVDADDQGEGAISAKCDLKLAATGTLYVEGNYNNGVHTTKDLEIQKQNLTVKAVNNALKGKDSVTIESGTVTAISTAGDGVKTEDTDVSSKGNQRGSVTVNDGTITVYAAGDGIQAAYNFVMNAGTLTIYTGANSSYTAKNASVSSYKGIKAQNELQINDGTLTVYSYDDGLHADYGTAFDNGAKGLGTITIAGGTVTLKVNSSAGRYVSGADAIHADNKLAVNGGTVDIESAYEGLEANVIEISGGDITLYASDDGINAAKKIGLTPAVTISGGKLDITMASGDTDGIDSNGSFTMTGGLVIVRGAPNSTSNMATGLDCDGTARITGGTFIQLGATETVPTLGSGCYKLSFGSGASGGFGPGGMGGFGGRGGRGGMGGFGGGTTDTSYRFTEGTWTLSGLDVSFSVASGSTYYGAVIYSSSLTSGGSYTLSNGSASYSATAGT